MLCTRRNYTSTVPDLQDLCSSRLELEDVELNCLELDPQIQRLTGNNWFIGGSELIGGTVFVDGSGLNGGSGLSGEAGLVGGLELERGIG